MSATIIPFRRKQPRPESPAKAIMSRFVAGIQSIREEDRREDERALAAALASAPEHIRDWYLYGRKQ